MKNKQAHIKAEHVLFAAVAVDFIHAFLELNI